MNFKHPIKKDQKHNKKFNDSQWCNIQSSIPVYITVIDSQFRIQGYIK